LVENVKPCGCSEKPTWEEQAAQCVAAIRERCLMEVGKNASWIFAHGGFAGLPYDALSLEQIEAVFAAVDFGSCDITNQFAVGTKVYNAWTRSYVCGGQTYSGQEVVITNYNATTALMQWKWIANEPLWAGLDGCIDAIIQQ